MSTQSDGGRLADLMRQQETGAPTGATTMPDLDEMLDVDTSEAKGFVGDLMPEDTWVRVRIVKVTPGKTSSGKKKVDVEYVVSSGKYVNRHLWRTYMREGKAVTQYLNLCSALGLYDATNQKPLATVGTLMNAELYVLVGAEPERPKMRVDPATGIEEATGEMWPARNVVKPWGSHRGLDNPPPGVETLPPAELFGGAHRVTQAVSAQNGSAPSAAAQPSATPSVAAPPQAPVSATPASSPPNKWDDAPSEE